jgi:type II secretory pathway component GspD/PulD (secretin)
MIAQFNPQMHKRLLWAVGLFCGLIIIPTIHASEPAAKAVSESSTESFETRLFTIRTGSLNDLLSKKDTKKTFEEFGIVFPAGSGISYRGSSGLLIVTHTNRTLDQIEEILLRLDPNTQRMANKESGETILKLDSIKISSVEFNETPLKQAVEWLIEEARRLDPERKGVNILMKPTGLDPAKITVTLNIRNVTLKQAIKFLTQVTGLKYRIESAAVLIFAKE